MKKVILLSVLAAFGLALFSGCAAMKSVKSLLKEEEKK